VRFGLVKGMPLSEPVIIDGVTYDQIFCLNEKRFYYSSTDQWTRAGWIEESCFFSPFSDYPREGVLGTGADGIWHHMIITKLGPEITIEIPDASFASVHYDCEPINGLQGLEGYSDRYNFRGFGDGGSGLKEISAAEFEELTSIFEKTRRPRR